MPGNILIADANADLFCYPKRDAQYSADKSAQLTIDDLHGNGLKLIYFLVRQNVLEMDEETYSNLVKLYQKDIEQYDEVDIENIDKLLAKVRINPVGLVRLIGDEFCDRGVHDYFTLKILEKLVQAKMPLEILISNHGIEFIEAYEKRKKFISRRLAPFHSVSMSGLQRLIDKDLVKRENVLSIINRYYKPVLKALSYTLNDEGTKISIFSHAGIGLNAIKALAKKFEIQYQDETVIELGRTIAKINLAFSHYVMNNRVHTLYTEVGMQKGYSNYGLDCDVNPFEFLFWNRDYEELDRPEQHPKGYFIDFIHGHDSDEEEMKKNIFILNSSLGSSLLNHQGSFTALFSRENSGLKFKSNYIDDEKIQPLMNDLSMPGAGSGLSLSIFGRSQGVESSHDNAKSKVAAPEIATLK